MKFNSVMTETGMKLRFFRRFVVSHSFRLGRLVSGHGFSRADQAHLAGGLQHSLRSLQRLELGFVTSLCGTAQSCALIQSQSARAPRAHALIQNKAVHRLTTRAASLVLLWCAAVAHAADLKLQTSVVAGNAATISASGGGSATLYVSGPGTAIKRQVQLGQAITISGEDLKNAGLYIVAIEGVGSGSFFVTSAPVASLAFLARPSRIPADTHDVISGTTFLFDHYQNLVMQPEAVKFDMSVNDQNLTRTEMSKNGIAYIKLDSSKKEGAAQFVASSGPASVRRVVQEVASDPCNIRMRAEPAKNGILVTTDPIRDCTGNPVPDGTIVTFTSTDDKGRSTVDARIKRGTAQAILPSSNNATISVAAGVVVGNEIHWRGGM